MGMTTLAEYLSTRKKAEFAKAIGTTPSYLSQILAETRKPSLALMVRIQNASNGVVDLNSWSPSSALDASLPDGVPPSIGHNGESGFQGGSGNPDPEAAR